jgi:RimJ/RimL family protein N-acetyltransferase
MRCEDRAMYVDAVAGLSARSRYLRFAAPTPRISESLLNRMMDFDGDRHVAHAALTRDGSTVVGVARFIRIDADPDAAEVAIAIADRWQGGGLGAALLSTVIERAREADVRRLTATMLSENRGAAALARAVGFSATGHAGIYAEYELALGRERGGSRPDS